MVGCLLCTGGLLVLVLTDSDSETGGSRPLLGDALVVAGAAVYAVCNIAQVWVGRDEGVDGINIVCLRAVC